MGWLIQDITVTEGYPPAVNVLSEEKIEQAIALGWLGWSLRLIQRFNGPPGFGAKLPRRI